MFAEIYTDLPEFDEIFMAGFEFFEKEKYYEALSIFLQGDREKGAKGGYHIKYQSFIGLCQVLSGDCSGLNVCRKLSIDECFDGDIFCNLAIAEYQLNHRKQAFKALEKGMAIDENHSGLPILFAHMDTRKEPPLSFLSRNNFLNVFIGKIAHRNENQGHSYSKRNKICLR